MFDNLYNAANEIRTLLMPFAFTLCVIGIGEMGGAQAPIRERSWVRSSSAFSS